MFQDKCRCCFFSIGSIHLSTIVKTAEGTDLTYREIFEVSSGFSVTPKEPQLICYSCADLTLQAQQFLALTKKTQSLLTATVFVDSIKSEIIIKEEVSVNFSDDDDRQDNYEATIDSREGVAAYKNDDDENIGPEIKSNQPIAKEVKRSKRKASDEEPVEPFFLNSLENESVEKFLCPYCPKDTDKNTIPGTKQKGRPRKPTYEKSHLIKHIRTSHPEAKKFNCSWCARDFYLEEHYNIHLKRCTKRPNRYKTSTRIICPYCAKMIPHNAFKKHINYHVEGPPPFFECDLCGSQHQFKTSLVNHIETKHLSVIPAARFHCKHCNAEFRQADRLKDHLLRDHQLGKKLDCHLCNYTTLVPKNLRRHLNRHNSEF